MIQLLLTVIALMVIKIAARVGAISGWFASTVIGLLVIAWLFEIVDGRVAAERERRRRAQLLERKVRKSWPRSDRIMRGWRD